MVDIGAHCTVGGSMRIRMKGWGALGFSCLLGQVHAIVGAVPVAASTVSVAAAANVEPALRELAPAFERATGHRLEVSAGATGKLTTQVIQGAPFEVLLAADEFHPKLLAQKGLALAETRFTFARGRLVLWSAEAGQTLGPETLRAARFAHLAIAAPDTAPYGAAAVEVMRKLGVYEALAPKLVQGESVGQTFAFVKSGAAEVGFVALSQLAGSSDGSRWLVPDDLHPPLVHQAALLAAGKDSPAARAFLSFLAGEAAQAILQRFGYVAP
jgi:molybdate transport system substrate-binding protein